MPTSYKNYPLALPLDDGGDDFEFYPLLVSNRILFAERFRRQGKVIYPAGSLWGLAERPATLTLNDALSINKVVWYRDSEPVNLSGYVNLGSAVPHGYWKWRIYCEPKGLTGALYEIDNPAGGGGASIMAEDFFTAEGVLTNLPTPFSAPNPSFAFTAGLQYGITTDGGSTVSWTNPIWN